MRILITGTGSLLGSALVRALAPQHDVRTLDLTSGLGESAPTFVGDPRDREFAARAVAGCDAVVHTCSLAHDGATAEDEIDRATRGTYNLITTAGTAKRFVLLSSLRLFERYPAHYLVTEQWAPRPTTTSDDLAPYLAELTVRECARVLPLIAVALRLGEVVADADVRDQPTNPRWLHVEDAVQAVRHALDFEPTEGDAKSGWWAYHIVGAGQNVRWPLGLAGQAPFGYQPLHDLAKNATAESSPASQAVIDRLAGQTGGAARRVVIYGAGGPLGAVVASDLERDHTLRLTDRLPLADIVAANRPQSPGAPLPRLLAPPHEVRVVDVTDPDEVRDAAQGMEAIINCSVVRPDPVQAFRVNTLGAYNVIRAAVANGIRRVVQTGPQQVTLPGPAGYTYDDDLSSDVPSRPGDRLYFITKFLGQEICRVFAEAHGLEVPTLLFSSFVNPTSPPPRPLGAYPFSVSWDDSAAAIRQALHAPDFPHPFEILNILGDLPHGKYSNEKARQLLNWQPRDRLESHWLR